MREHAKKPESLSRTLDSTPQASRQAPIFEILQEYRNSPSRCLPIQRNAIKDDMQLEEVTQMEEKAICQKTRNPIQLQAGDQTNAVIQLGGGRGNHVYNDFVEHFRKHWMSYLTDIITNFELDKTWLDELKKVLGTYQSSFREYTFSGVELFDKGSVSKGGANVAIFSDILSIINELFKNGMAFFIKSNPEAIYQYEQLLVTLIYFHDNIEYYVVDHEIELVERDSAIIDMFKVLIRITIKIIRSVCQSLYQSFLEEGGPEEKPEDFEIRIVGYIKKLSDARIKGTLRKGTQKAPQRILKGEDLRRFEMKRSQFHTSVRDVERLLVGGEIETIKTQAGSFQPDEIPSDGDCFFNALLALRGGGRRNVQQLRTLAAINGGHRGIGETREWAREEDINAIAKVLRIRIEVTRFDLHYRPIGTRSFGSVGPTYHIAHIFGGHFTPLRGVPPSAEGSVSASKAEKRE